MTVSTLPRTTAALPIARAGRLTPTDALELDELLDPLSTTVRPQLIVDLTDAVEVHPSVVSVLRRHQRRARQLGGELRAIAPRTDEARHTFEMVGLCSTRTPTSTLAG